MPLQPFTALFFHFAIDILLITDIFIHDKRKNNNMIIKKITPGFVTQTFDTTSMEYVSQNFIAGDQVDYENEKGTPLDQIEAAELGMEFDDGSEPYLPFDMLQPNEIKFAAAQLGNSDSCRESIQEDLLTFLDGMSNESRNHVCQIVVDNFKKFFGKE
jgi:hypothetical protein